MSDTIEDASFEELPKPNQFTIIIANDQVTSVDIYDTEPIPTIVEKGTIVMTGMELSKGGFIGIAFGNGTDPNFTIENLLTFVKGLRKPPSKIITL